MKRNMVGFSTQLDQDWLDQTAGLLAQGMKPKAVRAEMKRRLQGQVVPSRLPKVLGALGRTWLNVPDTCLGLRDRALALLPEATPDERLALHWAMTLATCPFFADMVDYLGRTLALGEVSYYSLLRNAYGQWGERSTVKVALDQVLASLNSWGTLLRQRYTNTASYDRKYLQCRPKVVLLLMEAVLMNQDGAAMSFERLSNNSRFFPFSQVATSVDYLSPNDLRNSGQFEVFSENLDSVVVTLKSPRKG